MKKHLEGCKTNQQVWPEMGHDGREVKNEEEVGEMFNEFIVTKIWRMRGGINMENKRDPLGPLAGDMEKKEILLFTL